MAVAPSKPRAGAVRIGAILSGRGDLTSGQRSYAGNYPQSCRRSNHRRTGDRAGDARSQGGTPLCRARSAHRIEGSVETLTRLGEAIAVVAATAPSEVENVIAILAVAAIGARCAQRSGKLRIFLPAIRTNQYDARSRFDLPQTIVSHGKCPAQSPQKLRSESCLV